MIKIKKISDITVILNKNENDRDFSLSTIFLTGSINEKENEKGLSHLLEHMLFTGTNKRNAYQITEEMDFYGANYNAYTSKEMTTYYFSSLTINQKETCDIFFDMITDPIFSEEQLKKEKEIIYEEIKMDLDDTDSVSYDLMQLNVIDGNLKNNIIGSKESVENITREMLINYYNKRYCKDNLIISVSGNYDEKILENQINEYFLNMNKYKVDDVNLENKFNLIEKFIKKEMNQVNVYLVTKYENKNDDFKKHIINIIINIVFGNGFSSKLFREIRENKTLAYSVYSHFIDYFNFSLFNIYIGTSKMKYNKAISTTMNLIKEFKKTGINNRELIKAKNNILSIKAQNKENRKLNNKNVSMYLKYKEIYTDSEIENIILDISLNDVNNQINNIFNEFSVFAIGDIDV